MFFCSNVIVTQRPGQVGKTMQIMGTVTGTLKQCSGQKVRSGTVTLSKRLPSSLAGRKDLGRMRTRDCGDPACLYPVILDTRVPFRLSPLHRHGRCIRPPHPGIPLTLRVHHSNSGSPVVLPTSSIPRSLIQLASPLFSLKQFEARRFSLVQRQCRGHHRPVEPSQSPRGAPS